MGLVLQGGAGRRRARRRVPGACAMSSGLQNWYWFAGIVGVVLSNCIAIAVFVRNKPDKIKAAITSAIEPLVKRMDKLEAAQTRQADEQTRQGRVLVQLEAEIKHLPKHDEISRLNVRLTDLVAQTSKLEGASNAEGVLLHRINQFLIQGK
jgi:hypothetical protein